MLVDEVKQLLRELAHDTGARNVTVVHEPVLSTDPLVLVEPLGHGAFLRIDLPGEVSGSPDQTTTRGDRHTRHEHAPMPKQRAQEAIDTGVVVRAVRALRACARRWQQTRVPTCSSHHDATPPTDRVHERIRAYLKALENAHGADVVLLTHRSQMVTASRPPDELTRERIPFIVRRVSAEAQRQRNSHAELASDDFYTRTFWFGACLVLFFSAPYAEDFVRHRVRLVARELVPLLSMLDEPPPTGIQVAPLPDE